MIYRSERPQPPRGSTAWGAQQFLRVLDEEERIAAERERLLAMGWHPPQTMIADPDDHFLGQDFNAYADRIERDRATRRALEEEARSRASIRLGTEAPGDPESNHPGGAFGSTPGWVGGGRFGVPVPSSTPSHSAQLVSTKIKLPGDATPRSVLDRQGSFGATNPFAWLGTLTLAEAMARYQAEEFAKRRELEAASRDVWRDMLPPEPQLPPRDFDPEEARRIQQQFGGPNVNIPPIIDTPPESIPIQGPIIPNILTGPDPSNPPQFPIWMEHRGSSATQWKTTEYARRTVELGRQNDQELKHSGGGYDKFGEPIKEEWYSNNQAGGGTRWSNYVDSTIHDKGTGRRILLQTIDTKTDGLTPSSREWLSNLRLMYNKKSGDYLVLVPKEVPLSEVDWDAFDAAMRPIVHEIGRPMNHGQRGTTIHPDEEWTLIDVRRMIK